MKTKLAFLITLSFVSSVFAASINTTRSNIKHPSISLDPGVWCYSVYEGGSPKAPSVVVEITTSVDDKCDESLKSALVTTEISLLVIDHDRLYSAKASYDVRPVSTMELLSSADGSTNQWPLRMMQNGTVKFFNNSKKYATDPYVEDSEKAAVQLELPSELQDLLEESSRDAEHVIIILREVQQGKK